MKKHSRLILLLIPFLLSCHQAKDLKVGVACPRDEYSEERKAAIIEQTDIAADLISDVKTSKEDIVQCLVPLFDTIDMAVCNSEDFEFVLTLRGFCRWIMPQLFQRGITLPDDCLMKLISIPYKWTVYNTDTSHFAHTSMFRSSSEMWDRMANVCLIETNDIQAALLIVTNYIDTVMTNISLSFIDSTNNKYFFVKAEDGNIDSSNLDDGIIRIFYPFDIISPHLTHAEVIKLTYDTPDEQVEMVHLLSLPGFSSAEQLKNFTL